MRTRSGFVFASLCFGFAFLYLPLALVVLYSFNDSQLVTLWGGFSTRWYVDLFRNREILDAALLSLRIAALSATIATVLGTAAALALVRLGHFRGRVLFSGLTAAPLVMPEIITGLSLLLFFVALQKGVGWPAGRGALTITLAHITFCTAFVAIIIQSRLTHLDETLEDAAMDLGGRPLRVLADITLPLLAPGMLAGWLLAFTLSLDNLVITSFVTGPGATTLPLLIFSKIRQGVTPDINALASIIIATVACGVAAAAWVLLWRGRTRPSPSASEGWRSGA